MPMPRIDPRMLQMLMQQQQQPQGLTLNSAPPMGAAPMGAAPMGAAPMGAAPPVIPVGSPGRDYGTLPVQGMTGGTPYIATEERSMRNMEQAKLLQQAIKAIRLSAGK
jgi:hypothetical protein